jgi:hypothetical protein
MVKLLRRFHIGFLAIVVIHDRFLVAFLVRFVVMAERAHDVDRVGFNSPWPSRFYPFFRWKPLCPCPTPCWWPNQAPHGDDERDDKNASQPKLKAGMGHPSIVPVAGFDENAETCKPLTRVVSRLAGLAVRRGAAGGDGVASGAGLIFSGIQSLSQYDSSNALAMFRNRPPTFPSPTPATQPAQGHPVLAAAPLGTKSRRAMTGAFRRAWVRM